jgi:hypothetical protein
MPNTYTELLKTTVGTATSSVTLDLTGISGYTDLVIVANGTSSGDASFMMRFNGDSASNYSTTYLYGTGSSVVSGRASNDTYIVGMGRTNTTGGASIIHLQNYANTTTYKTVIGRGSAAASLVIAAVGLWRSTSAITSILITPESSNTISVGSTFSLYGIANADQGAAKATGGIITEDATYWYHTFAASSAFIPKQSLTCDVLVVAGGGGGGYGAGGGGGAGGLLAYTSQALTAISYNVTVGAGGAAGTAGSQVNNGVNSQFASLTASTGGGGGASWTGGSGVAAGSGGSGGGGTTTTYTSGGTGSQGNNGGTGFATSNQGSGGGGGFGAVGGNASSGVGGAGGAGTSTYSSWLTATGTGLNGFIAGGGGGIGGGGSGVGGAGGSGGGGGGANGSTPTTFASPGVKDAVVNTGGGGGGGFGSGGFPVGNGGSGVVIVRYAK